MSSLKKKYPVFKPDLAKEKKPRNNLNFSVYNQSIRPSLSKINTNAKSLKRLSSLVLDKPQNSLSGSYFVQNLNDQNEGFLQNLHWFKSKAKIVEYRLDQELALCVDGDCEKEYKVYESFFKEITQMLKPFDKILGIIMEGMKKYWTCTSENGKFVKSIKDLEELNRSLADEISKVSNEKDILAKKLNVSSDYISKIVKEKEEIVFSLKETEKKVDKQHDKTINTENLLNNMIDQFQKTLIQEEKIRELNEKEKKYMKILEVCSQHFGSLDNIIKEAEKSFSESY